MNPPKLFIATKAFIIHDGKVLILREAGSYQDGTNTGRYDLPGGRLNPGERFDDALAREIQEETGLSVNIGNPIAVNEWRPIVREEPWHIVGIFFKCETSSSAVTLSEDHDQYLWIDPVKYTDYPVIENLRIVFEKYNA